MKRSSSLVTITRREFCAAVGFASAAGLVIAGCSSDGSPQAPDASVLPLPASGGSTEASGACGDPSDEQPAITNPAALANPTAAQNSRRVMVTRLDERFMHVD